MKGAVLKCYPLSARSALLLRSAWCPKQWIECPDTVGLVITEDNFNQLSALIIVQYCFVFTTVNDQPDHQSIAILQSQPDDPTDKIPAPVNKKRLTHCKGSGGSSRPSILPTKS
ncbi:hypothetical protein HRR83_006636 [Exophiala dermatitidis]|uniref:Uncharacterized protein n=1 Tax=Exophiala dermatitidis TaxID=5970 RepID=A0AAN6ITM8_EXODE|nr:hypothetical protein HRR74_005796 [Exophiala dermatitidis]KAJ4515379.1 hypothetical protein HRR73_005210 [Exophiala dermatitidis]KAJ4533785.1 hypothetical protein HRR77_008270 [Exophiala dermatitidis]KAJ4540906.1 hypothetical protein HRR76_004289 [Exophiala dermatitidis]KAJ4560538.1 hypothetical protein HRR79_007946 [Exophiala dermatitidis]